MKWPTFHPARPTACRLASALLGALVCTFATTTVAAATVDFNRDIRPLLAARCFKCHGADEHRREADLRLDDSAAATRDLGGYAAVAPGDPDSSELIARVETDDESMRMPPADDGAALSADEIALLRAWIAQGAKYDRHWAFVAPKKPAPPESDSSWPANEIDDFVLATLQEHNLETSQPADRRTLIRRLYLDLSGLPPSVDDVRAFLADSEIDAYERLVDRVLASPHSAERLAMAWLDAARYADTNGFSIDDHRDMWAWRDWVIDAFARNMPYDEFIRDQFAGDLLPAPTPNQLLATGFLRNSMNTHEGGTLPEEYHVISIADKVDAAATCFLGLTVKCAQCHDHKYDPISHRDYYRFFALFNDSSEPGTGAKNGNTTPTMPVASPLTSAAEMAAHLDRRIADLERQLHELTPELRDQRRTWQSGEMERLRGERKSVSLDGTQDQLLAALETADDKLSDEQRRIVFAAYRAAWPPAQQYAASIEEEIRIIRQEQASAAVMVMDHADAQRKTHILLRGQYDQLGEVVEPGVPAGLGGPDRPVRNRLELAQWITDSQNPLAARVAVNRYWQMLFGVGLVSTSEDLGTRSTWPTHPELLDWLAMDFEQHGWDVRRLLKQIVTSATYRQSSHISRELADRDPHNQWLARGPIKRLEAEFVRDNGLAIAGELNADIGGPSVYPDQPVGLWQEVSHYGHPEVFTAQAYYPSTGADARRRSMYSFWKRTCPPPSLLAFDAPSREMCVIRRGSTTTPLQSLVLLNDPQYTQAARKFAQRIVASAGDDETRLQFAFETALSRPPSDEESGVILRRLQTLTEQFSEDHEQAESILNNGEGDVAAADDATAREAAWTVVATIILNLRETITSY